MSLSPALWLKADAITGLSDGAAVASWLDSSGNSRTATQATGGLQPIYKTNILNGNPVVRFSTQKLVTPAFANTATRTIFAVANLTGGSGEQSIIDADWGPNLFRFRYIVSTTVFRTLSWNAAATTNASAERAATLASFNVLTAVHTNTTSQAFVNGTGSSVATLSSGTMNSGSAAVGIGAQPSPSSAFAALIGDIAEILIYPSVLSTTDRQNVEAYLKAKYATA